MKIRPATSADVDALIRIGRRSPTAPQWSDNQYDQLFSPKPSRETLVLVIEEYPRASVDPILGFLVASHVQSEWELENIAVDPPASRRGLATQLLGDLDSRVASTGGGAIFLEVRASNAAARGLYEKCGFLSSGLRKNYYAHPLEDAIVYRRSLTTT
jgi:ribosomal-protein-alanine N-acetyltransferase